MNKANVANLLSKISDDTRRTFRLPVSITLQVGAVIESQSNVYRSVKFYTDDATIQNAISAAIIASQASDWVSFSITQDMEGGYRLLNDLSLAVKKV